MTATTTTPITLSIDYTYVENNYDKSDKKTLVIEFNELRFDTRYTNINGRITKKRHLSFATEEFIDNFLVSKRLSADEFDFVYQLILQKIEEIAF